jgi:hypothetical protein
MHYICSIKDCPTGGLKNPKTCQCRLYNMFPHLKKFKNRMSYYIIYTHASLKLPGNSPG